MDEQLTAIIVASVTAFSGMIIAFITTRLAKNKSKEAESQAVETPPSSYRSDPVMEHLLTLRTEIRDNRYIVIDEIHKIKDKTNDTVEKALGSIESSIEELKK